MIRPAYCNLGDNRTLLSVMCNIAERGLDTPLSMHNVSDDACSVASLARLSYLKIIYRYLSRLYVV